MVQRPGFLSCWHPTCPLRTWPNFRSAGWPEVQLDAELVTQPLGRHQKDTIATTPPPTCIPGCYQNSRGPACSLLFHFRPSQPGLTWGFSACTSTRAHLFTHSWALSAKQPNIPAPVGKKESRKNVDVGFQGHSWTSVALVASHLQLRFSCATLLSLSLTIPSTNRCCALARLHMPYHHLQAIVLRNHTSSLSMPSLVTAQPLLPDHSSNITAA